MGESSSANGSAGTCLVLLGAEPSALAQRAQLGRRRLLLLRQAPAAAGGAARHRRYTEPASAPPHQKKSKIRSSLTRSTRSHFLNTPETIATAPTAPKYCNAPNRDGAAERRGHQEDLRHRRHHRHAHPPGLGRQAHRYPPPQSHPTLGNTLAFAGSAAGTGPSNRRPRVACAQASRTPPPATSATGTTPRPTQAPTPAPLPSLHLPSRAMNAER